MRPIFKVLGTAGWKGREGRDGYLVSAWGLGIGDGRLGVNEWRNFKFNLPKRKKNKLEPKYSIPNYRHLHDVLPRYLRVHLHNVTLNHLTLPLRYRLEPVAASKQAGSAQAAREKACIVVEYFRGLGWVG